MTHQLCCKAITTLPKHKCTFEEDQVIDPKIVKMNIISIVKQARIVGKKWGIRASMVAAAAEVSMKNK